MKEDTQCLEPMQISAPPHIAGLKAFAVEVLNLCTMSCRAEIHELSMITNHRGPQATINTLVVAAAGTSDTVL